MTPFQGFTDGYCDPMTASYPLGHGYRRYVPSLMRFAAPDHDSPFGAGGIHPYSYCGCDPINAVDPSGHNFFKSILHGLTTFGHWLGTAIDYMSPIWVLTHKVWHNAPAWVKAIGDAGKDIGVAAVAIMGLVAAPVTGGLSAALVGVAIGATVLSTAFQVAGDITNAISGRGARKAGEILDWASMGTGAVSGVVSLGELVTSSMKVFQELDSLEPVLLKFGRAAGMGSTEEMASTFTGAVKVYMQAGRIMKPMFMAAKSAAIDLGFNVGLPVAMYLGEKLFPPPPIVLARSAFASVSNGDAYPEAFGYPQSFDTALLSAYANLQPAGPPLVPAGPPLRSGYPSHYATLWA